MKNFRFVFITLLLLVFLSNCENVGLAGQGGVKGSKAKEEILSIATQNSIILGVAYNLSATSIVFSIVIDGVVVPSLAGVSDSAHYSRPSVNACKSKMSSVGLLLGTWIGALTCDLKTTPSVLQLGDGDNGSVLQLGPIGL